MEKRQHAISLSFVLLRFGFTMMICMFACCVIWFAGLSAMESRGIVYPGHIGNQQVEKMITQSPAVFQTPNEDFLAEFALFDKSGNLIVSNVHGKAQNTLLKKAAKRSSDTLQHTYADESYAVFRWHFRKEFAHPTWRASLPPFEYLWWITLAIACALCWLFNSMWLRKQLVKKLGLFQVVSEKVGAQELNFEIPYAGIQEFDQALDAMERMRQALYASLSSQWAAQQQRDSEIAALAHDLKTPLTLIDGNAQLLLEDDLQQTHRKMVKTILNSNKRAKQYVNSLLEAACGEDEAFACVPCQSFVEILHNNALAVADRYGVGLNLQNNANGSMCMQKQHLSRAIGNVVQNAIEYTPKGGMVTVKSFLFEDGWQITIQDGGPGFSQAAIHHATERLWRGDSARASTGHNGLGLWFASLVIQNHGGQILLDNYNGGGLVIIKFKRASII